MTVRFHNQLWYGFLRPEDRAKLAFEISYIDREIRKQKLRREHPEWCEIEVMNEILRYAFTVKSEPIPESLEKQMQQRVNEWRASHAAQGAQAPAPQGGDENSPSMRKSAASRGF
jgi:hypothetical protein